jgi:hypothetical protein
VADAFFCGDQIGDFIAAEQVPEAVAEDAVPCAVEGGLGGGAEGGDGVDADGVEAHFHGTSDACQIAELERMQDVGEVVVFDEEESVGFAHLAGDFGEVFVGGGANADLDVGGHVFGDALFDLSADRADGIGFAEVVGQPGPHFVDGEDGFDVDAVFHGFDDLVVEADVFGGFAFDDGDAGAEGAGVADAGAGFHAEGLGFVGSGDAAGGFRHDGGDTYGSPAQGGVEVLFDGGEVGIAVYEECGERVGHAPRECAESWQVKLKMFL